MNKRLGKTIGVLAIGVALVGGGAQAFAQEAATPGAVDDAYSPFIDPANFSTVIDNPYYPLTPGTTWVYEGMSEDGPERNEVTVTTDTKVVMGVECVVVHDVVSVNDEVVEDTLDYYTQDSDGNVWYFGEESKDIENGEVVSTHGSWEAGVDGALPGIQMLASPQESIEYRQEYYAGEAEDRARVIETNGTASVAFGDFENVLVTQDWNPLEPDVLEQKMYAPGVGLIAEQHITGGAETSELIEVTQP